MKWRGEEISKLSDEDLFEAIGILGGMDNFVFDKKNDKRYEKRFKNQPKPKENPIFLQLVNEVQSEITKRKL